ncbi:hypothetical protein BKA70DRAFT_1242693 [Coprinopsis sp. MPI-PUGE-AT-0042]|nr:hypothetical protein BKA70DRAFT_1242693 [Coprinopsis sp. MPI-PUGE-AT-0042]
MADEGSQTQGHTFTFSLSDASTTFRGTDGRTGTRETRQTATLDHEISSASLFSPPETLEPEDASRYAKRACQAPKPKPKPVKRPVGRPRKHPLVGGLAVELGSFRVSGSANTRSQSVPATSSRTTLHPEASHPPLAPIFLRGTQDQPSSHSQLPLSSTSQLPSQAPSTPHTLVSIAAPAAPYETRERIIPEDEDEDEVGQDLDDEVDGRGDGGGDDTDDEGDEEDPEQMATTNEQAPEASLDGSTKGKSSQKASQSRTPLPEWLKAAFDARVEEYGYTKPSEAV